MNDGAVTAILRPYDPDSRVHLGAVIWGLSSTFARLTAGCDADWRALIAGVWDGVQ